MKFIQNLLVVALCVRELFRRKRRAPQPAHCGQYHRVPALPSDGRQLDDYERSKLAEVTEALRADLRKDRQL